MKHADLTEPQRRGLAERAMHDLIQKASNLSFSDIYRAGNIAAGYAQFDQFSPCYRLADRLIQRMRKAGHIEKSRQQGGWVWSITPAGRRALQEEQK